MKILQKEGQQPKIVEVSAGHLGLVYTSFTRGHQDPLHFLNPKLSKMPFEFTAEDHHNFVGYRAAEFLPKIVPTSNGWYSKGESEHLWGPRVLGHKLLTQFTLVEYSPAIYESVRGHIRIQTREGNLSPRLERYALEAGVTRKEMREWNDEWRMMENNRLQQLIIESRQRNSEFALM